MFTGPFISPALTPMVLHNGGGSGGGDLTPATMTSPDAEPTEGSTITVTKGTSAGVPVNGVLTLDAVDVTGDATDTGATLTYVVPAGGSADRTLTWTPNSGAAVSMTIYPAPWTPADEIVTGKYMWEGLASDFTGTALPDHNGGSITLSVVSAAPSLIADAGDGMAALRCNVDNASQRLRFDNPLTLGAESLFLLIKPTAASSALSALLAMGNSIVSNSTFQLDAAAIGSVPPNLNGNGSVPDISGVTNRIDTWITAIVELDPANSQVRYWINGSQVGSGSYSPAGGTISVARFVLFSDRGQTYSCRADFAHGFLLHEVGASVRAKGIDYLQRLWGARVVGW